tara:strand:+ start:61 stop:384 length:324 start_codon:yes stop_codon:yes gene_type:complete
MKFKNFNIVRLVKENDLSKVIKTHKRSKEDFSILFVSLWDENSEKLMVKLYESSEEKAKTLYIVDSFNMPHSFVIYNTKVVPALVNVSKDNTEVIDYLPKVYECLEA